jgi:mannose-6-phosphate isomerase-like protein (cupin superfamily)
MLTRDRNRRTGRSVREQREGSVLSVLSVVEIVVALACASPALAAPPLADRHTDPREYRRSRSHGSAGDMACATLVERNVLPFLNFVHRQSHAILNPTGQAVEFLNVNVAAVDGEYDAEDLGDARVGAAKDATASLTAVRFDRALLRPRGRVPGGGAAVLHRRALGPEFFRGNWSYVDHLVLPAGASAGVHRDPEVGEVYCAMSGRGEVRIGDQAAAVAAGDAVPILAGEAHSFTAAASQELELMVVGIAPRQ